jgi:hypothetical protein
MVGGLRADLRAAVFRTRKNEYFLFDEGKSVMTTGGCEPGFTADGRFMYWVEGPRDFRAWDIAAGREIRFFGRPPVRPYDYTYFPTVSGGNRWLTYGASPGQHDHSKSDYEIFVQELDGWRPVGRPVRLSWDKRTDRWPHLHVYGEGAPPTPLPGLVADSWARHAPEDAAPARPVPAPPEVFPVADERAPDEVGHPERDEAFPVADDGGGYFPVADDREESFPVAGGPAPREPDEAFPVAAGDGPVPF